MITRRGAMAVSLGAGLAPLAARRAEAEPWNADLKLWYQQPAAAWVEALPVGNGRLAAMVHFLDVGGEPVPEAKGFETVLAGARERLPDDDALLAEMSGVLDSFYTSFRRG